MKRVSCVDLIFWFLKFVSNLYLKDLQETRLYSSWAHMSLERKYLIPPWMIACRACGDELLVVRRMPSSFAGYISPPQTLFQFSQSIFFSFSSYIRFCSTNFHFSIAGHPFIKLIREDSFFHWTPGEDEKLLAYIQEHVHGSWRASPSKAGTDELIISYSSWTGKFSFIYGWNVWSVDVGWNLSCSSRPTKGTLI